MTQDLDSLLRSSLSNQEYVGHRPELWEQQTAVELMVNTKSKVLTDYKEVDVITDFLKLRDELLKELHEHVVELHFTKADGTATSLYGTLARKFLPVEELEKFKPVEQQTIGEVLLAPDPLLSLNSLPRRVENMTVVGVWSIDRQGWRTIRLESLTKIVVHHV